MAFVVPALAAVGGALGASAASAATVGAIAIGTTVSVMGAAAGALASHNAAEFNAKIEEQKAQQSADLGAIKASEVARQNRQQQASGRASALENGLSLSGSTNDLLDQADRQGQLDYLTAVYEGRTGQVSAQSNARLDRMNASNSIYNGILGAASQGFSGVASIYKARGNSIAVSGTG